LITGGGLGIGLYGALKRIPFEISKNGYFNEYPFIKKSKLKSIEPSTKLSTEKKPVKQRFTEVVAERGGLLRVIPIAVK
jgi:hypothetical protein